MREFKFIRGVYKDENIFNSDETSGLFALYKDGDFISFNTKNNNKFQDKITNLNSDDREIYTIRLSQFKTSAKKESTDYSFDFDLDGNANGNSKTFPDTVKSGAKSHLKSKTSAKITGEYPNLNFGDEIVPTTVNFTYKGEKTIQFNRNLVFKVSGFIKEKTYKAADGENVTIAYETDNRIIIYDNPIENLTFNEGKKQVPVDSIEKTIYSNTVDVDEDNYRNLPIASSYISKAGYIFYIDKNNDDNVDNKSTGFSYGDSVGQTYILYKIESGKDIYVGECKIRSLDRDTIVKGYNESYKDCYIKDAKGFRQVEEYDLDESSIYVYDSDDYHIKGNGVYKDDPDDEKHYVMFYGSEEQKEITKDNTTVNGDTVSPILTNNTFRQIVEGTLNIEATES